MTMASQDSVKLGLLENSHAFLREAVANALAARNDVRKWQFAILHLVQSLELSVKALLHRVHPVFIYEDIDKRKQTVSLSGALLRLQCAEIAGIPLAQHELAHIERIVELRNRITHSEFELKAPYAEAKFFEVFALVARFQGQHLDTEIDSILTGAEIGELLSIKKALDEMSAQAASRIAEEKRSSELVWVCPSCGRDTFVIEDDINTCYTCRHVQSVVECHYCKKFHFADDMEDFSGEFDVCKTDGQYEIHNDYGYRKTSACPACVGQIRDDIQQQRDDDYYRYMERMHEGF
jgi:hypothetical protein